MDKQEIYKLLENRHLWHKVFLPIRPYTTWREMVAVSLPYPEADAKNLFVRDDKKQQYYLMTVQGNKRVNLKEFRKKNNTRPLSFASEEELMAILGLFPGAVTPLGLLNDTEHKVQCFIDRAFLDAPGSLGCIQTTIQPPYS